MYKKNYGFLRDAFDVESNACKPEYFTLYILRI